MGIKSIKIKNLLSFDELHIKDVKDINCIIGRNNVGKSNLLKLLKFFYNKLEGKRELPPRLYNNYAVYGSITIEYDLTRLARIAISSFKTAKGNSFFRHIGQKLLPPFYFFMCKQDEKYEYTLTLKIYSNDVVEWSTEDKEIHRLINFLFPFFEIEARHIDLYDWDKLWYLASRLKSFKVENIQYKDLINFLNKGISGDNNAYSDYIRRIGNITNISKYTYREKVLNFIKVGLKGQTFTIDGNDLTTQSDGTNSHRYIELFLELLISLTRTSYISPIVYIDEPEIGLHPKKNEYLISKLYDVYSQFKKNKQNTERGKYKTPYPSIFIATHSPNIVKMIIKLFKNDQQVFHFSKDTNTKVTRMNSVYDDLRFLNIFSDNEARLFFSEKILFVEGETELEVFSNISLLSKFTHLRSLDVYKTTNNVILEHVNPSYANMAIPYLILFDADKVLKFNFSNSRIDLLSKFRTQFNKLIEKYEFAIYETEYFYHALNVKALLHKLPKPLSLNQNKLYVRNDDYYELISEINTIFSKDNYRVITTTIEGILINNSSFKLFKLWLTQEIQNNLYVKSCKGDDNRRIESEKRKYDEHNDLSKICNALLSEEPNYIELSNEHIQFIDSLKEQCSNHIWNELVNKFNDEKELVIAIRLVFSGKSETLVSKINEDYRNYMDEEFKKKILDIQNKDLKLVNYLFNKTSGWVTKFIDYSIDWIDQYEKDKNFEDVFKLYFPEFHSIIKKLQF